MTNSISFHEVESVIYEKFDEKNGWLNIQINQKNGYSFHLSLFQTRDGSPIVMKKVKCVVTEGLRQAMADKKSRKNN